MANGPAVSASAQAGAHTDHTPAHTRSLSVIDGVAMLVGVVVGIGIFGFPPLVALHAASPAIYIGLWLAGGLVMLVGALCYAELGSAYPESGGEYTFLRRAWGAPVAILFAWARGTVIQTGAIAAVAFIYGEYAQVLWPLGAQGTTLHALIAVAALTALNVIGTRESKRLQLLFTGITLVALLVIVLTGLLGPAAPAPAIDPTASPSHPGYALGTLGMGMVFVLLTYGGWNEAAYLAGELREPQRNMPRVLLGGTVIVTAVYLLANVAYLHIFGLDGLRNSQAIGAALMEQVAGPRAGQVLSLLICATALSTINGTIFTGSRVYYALGRDVPGLSGLGAWQARGQTPARALLLQGAITLALILFGAWMQGGVQTMVAYTAPVFWLFMALTALSLIRLRQRDPQRARPFRVPLYPVTPLLLAASCLGLVWSSAVYAGAGAWLGLLVLAAGVPLLWMDRASRPH